MLPRTDPDCECKSDIEDECGLAILSSRQLKTRKAAAFDKQCIPHISLEEVPPSKRLAWLREPADGQSTGRSRPSAGSGGPQ